MNDISFNILKIVISIVSALIAAYLVPYIRNRLHDEKYKSLLEMVTIAVMAAEQTIGKGNGAVKKDEVVTFVTMWMAERGMRISEEQLSQLIEAAVFSLNKELKA